MKKWQRNTFIGIIIGIVLVGGYFGWQAISFSDEPTQAPAPEETDIKAERISIELMVAKFNAKIMDVTQWELNPADDAKMVTHENNYWYPLTEELSLVVVPETFTGDKAKDIAKVGLIYSNKDENNRHAAREYWQYLIAANANLTAEKIAELMIEAERLMEKDVATENVDGIMVAVFQGDDHYEYQVLRNY